MAHLEQSEWDEYEAIVNEFQEDAFQENITWVRTIDTFDEFGEDRGEDTENVNLKGLVQYNHFRSWPMSQNTNAGEIDKESVLLYLNNKYLNDAGYINANGMFAFNKGLDKFIIRGYEYKPSGESQVSQINNKPLLHFIILKREEKDTGSITH